MLKKTVTYTDYNGNERTEDHYFNLNKAELMELEMSVDGGLTTMIKRISSAQDGPSIMKVFKEILSKSYGIKSDDGKRFIKSEEIFTAFSQTEAYSAIFMELVTDDNASAKFIEGVIPSDLAKEIGEMDKNEVMKLV